MYLIQLTLVIPLHHRYHSLITIQLPPVLIIALLSSLIPPASLILYVSSLKVESFCRFHQNVSTPYKAEMTVSDSTLSFNIYLLTAAWAWINHILFYLSYISFSICKLESCHRKTRYSSDR